MNDAYLGTIRRSGSRRPRFVWEASTSPAGALIGYELQYSADLAMSDAISVTTERTDYQPEADLDVALLPPVGRRYYWRVRACSQGACSEFSRMRWINVGRTKCDFNADGYDDVAVGAIEATSGPGAVYFYYGSPDERFGMVSNGVLFGPGGSTSGFGAALSCAGDVDGDGYSDVLVGAPYSEVYKGAAFIYRGDERANFGGQYKTTILGRRDHGLFGGVVASAGDVNADGFGDVLVGAWSNSDGYLYLGGVSGVDSVQSIVLAADIGKPVVDVIVSAAGDVNGDGFSDVMVAFHAEGRQMVRVYHGNPGHGFDVVPKVELGAPSEDHTFGHSIAAAGDVNGDGFGDVIVGALEPERAYIYLGSPGGLASTPDITLTGESGTNFGIVVASAGDMNGDGFGDVAVGTSDYSGIPGVIFVYLGGAKLRSDEAPDIAFYKPAEAAGFGTVVGSSGDVNGDGYADLIAAAPVDHDVFMYLGQSKPVTPGTENGSVSERSSEVRFGVAISNR